MEFNKLRTCFLIFALSFGILLQGQSNKGKSFSITINKSEVLAGNTVRVDFEMKNTEGEFEAPAFKDFDIVSGPNVSSSMYNVNGETTSSKKYTYYLKPKKEGKLFIESAYLIVGNDEKKNLETSPTSLTVKPNPKGIIEEEEDDFGMGNSFFSFPDIRADDSFLRQRWGGNLPQEPLKEENPKPKRKLKKF
jgi:hypothetical protein